jgi:hypothetical protein
MRVSEGHQTSYQVVVLGELKPAVLAFCGGTPTHNEASGVFRLRLREGQGIAEVAAMLQAAGVMILSIRLVSQREAWTATGLPTELIQGG